MRLTWNGWRSSSDGLAAAPGSPLTVLRWPNWGFALFAVNNNREAFDRRRRSTAGPVPMTSSVGDASTKSVELRLIQSGGTT
jgi:hypothetical protein